MGARKYRALSGWVIVRTLAAPSQTAGGIIIPETARDKAPRMWGHEGDDQCWHQRGEVLSVGQGCRLFVEKWEDPDTGAPRQRERLADPDGIEAGDVIVFGWVGAQLEPGVYRVKIPDVHVVDDRSDAELSIVGEPRWKVEGAALSGGG